MRRVQHWLQSKPSMWIQHSGVGEKVIELAFVVLASDLSSTIDSTDCLRYEFGRRSNDTRSSCGYRRMLHVDDGWTCTCSTDSSSSTTTPTTTNSVLSHQPNTVLQRRSIGSDLRNGRSSFVAYRCMNAVTYALNIMFSCFLRFQTTTATATTTATYIDIHTRTRIHVQFTKKNIFLSSLTEENKNKIRWKDAHIYIYIYLCIYICVFGGRRWGREVYLFARRYTHIHTVTRKNAINKKRVVYYWRRTRL